jgi:hypothetical protein
MGVRGFGGVADYGVAGEMGRSLWKHDGSRYYGLNSRKNICKKEMELVTTFWPSMTMGRGIGLPDHRRNQIGGGLERVVGRGKTGVGGRPGQNHVGSVRGDGQWRRQCDNLTIDVWFVLAGDAGNLGENRYGR